MDQIIIVFLNSPHFRSQILQSSFDLGHKIYSKANITIGHFRFLPLFNDHLHNGNKVSFSLFFSRRHAQIRHQLLRRPRADHRPHSPQAVRRLHVRLLAGVAHRRRYRDRHFKRSERRRRHLHVHSRHLASSGRRNPGNNNRLDWVILFVKQMNT